MFPSGLPWKILASAHHLILDLLAAGAKDLPPDSPFPLVNDDFCTQINTNESAPDCLYGEFCEKWTPLRAAAFYGCPEQLAGLLASQHPIAQNTEHSALGSLLYTAASVGRIAVAGEERCSLNLPSRCWKTSTPPPRRPSWMPL